MSRGKPIFGMWLTLTTLSFAFSMILGESSAPSAPLFGTWPTVMVVWMMLTLFFDWVVQSTGLGALQTAVILGFSQILVTGVPGVMLEGMAFGEAAIAAVFGMLFWVFAGGAYGWLSSSD